jgi:endonuclease/exonuclease/phosphatase family metal-dependent hydrolase
MLRRKLSMLILALSVIGATLTLTAGPAQAHGFAPLTVLNFNIHHAAGTDEVLDLDRIADVIKDSEADVVGLQEVDRHYSERSEWADQPAELAERLGFHVVYGANIDQDPPEGSDDRIQYGTAILSRYPITDWGNTYLYNTEGREQRGLLHAEIAMRGQRVDFYTTHLDASSQPHRLEQARQIVDLIGDNDPAVLVGDFNALPDAPEIQILDEAYTDAWTAAGHGDGSTYPAEDPTKRIDNIYITDGVRAVHTEVLHETPEASDHLPVLSKVLIKRGPHGH